MTVRRRMIIQITSLVDLLFIVMFLQYMELRDASARQVRAEGLRRQQAEVARVQAESAKAQAVTAQADANRLKETVLSKTSELTQHIQQLENENHDLQKQLDEANSKLSSAALNQQEQEKKAYRELQEIAGVVKDMLGVPPEALQAVLGGAPEAERAQIRRRLEQLRNQPKAQLVQNLRETAELKKYCEIWEVHIYADGSIRLKIGGDDSGRDGGKKFFAGSDDEVANRVVEAAKEHGEPKSLVILCLTWGNAELSTRERVTKGLKSAVIALKGEWGGNKRIELARLGYAEMP